MEFRASLIGTVLWATLASLFSDSFEGSLALPRCCADEGCTPEEFCNTSHPDSFEVQDCPHGGSFPKKRDVRAQLRNGQLGDVDLDLERRVKRELDMKTIGVCECLPGYIRVGYKCIAVNVKTMVQQTDDRTIMESTFCADSCEEKSGLRETVFCCQESYCSFNATLAEKEPPSNQVRGPSAACTVLQTNGAMAGMLLLHFVLSVLTY